MRGPDFKEQLLEFVEDREEPFDVEFLARNCNDKLIRDDWIRGALWELEEEGQIATHAYLTITVLGFFKIP